MSKKKKVWTAIGFYTVSTIIIIIWLFPFVIGLFSSFRSEAEIAQNVEMWKPPQKVSQGDFAGLLKDIYSNYKEAWVGANMGRYMLNTLLITVFGVIGALFFSSMSAFALSYYKFKLGKILLILFVGGMLIPFQMLLIPVAKFSDLLHFRQSVPGNFIGIILFHIAFQLGFCTFFLRNFMNSIPKSIYESARIDGATDFGIFFKITLPLTLPAIAALGIFLFTWIWNDYLWSLILLTQQEARDVTLGVAQLQGEHITQYSIIAAASIIAMSFPVVIFLIFQRFFIEGLTVGAVKG